MKRIIPYVLAAAVFVLAYVFLAPPGKTQVVAAAQDLVEGHTLTADDLQLVPVERPPDNALTDIQQAVGLVLQVDRAAGDLILSEQLGTAGLRDLRPDERAIGIEVTDSAGLAGTLKPGDLVGVTAVIQVGQDTYSKVIGEGYRVMYVSPDFKALDPQLYEQNQQSGQYNSAPPTRQSTGVVVLAVPVDASVIAYDFPYIDVPDETRTVYVMDLLPALDHARDVELSLFLLPDSARAFRTSGVYVPDLAVLPPPTPTPQPADALDASAVLTETQPMSSTVPLATPTPEAGR
ncbi:MAG: Flp pilus assembly protein CpaB [Deltaproteobacteria bacterium]|nr:MAG: Flp pilus assembly protein CpaB [Deltaproteobacteria bacterium]